jgi:hypothetical protein
VVAAHEHAFALGRTLIRKTSLLQDHSNDGRGQASADMNCASRNDHLAMTITIGCNLEKLRACCQRKPDGSPPRVSAWSDLLFTMSDNTPTSDRPLGLKREQNQFTKRAAIPLVEPDGIEPTTSCLQSRRSPN